MKTTQSKASRHLRFLRNAGLLDDTGDGLWVYYQIHHKPGKAAKDILEALHDITASISLDKLLKDLHHWLWGKTRPGNLCSNYTR